jgi:hypothetical protein
MTSTIPSTTTKPPCPHFHDVHLTWPGLPGRNHVSSSPWAVLATQLAPLVPATSHPVTQKGISLATPTGSLTRRTSLDNMLTHLGANNQAVGDPMPPFVFHHYPRGQRRRCARPCAVNVPGCGGVRDHAEGHVRPGDTHVCDNCAPRPPSSRNPTDSAIAGWISAPAGCADPASGASEAECPGCVRGLLADRSKVRWRQGAVSPLAEIA